jgi:hypothetical protein
MSLDHIITFYYQLSKINSIHRVKKKDYFSQIVEWCLFGYLPMPYNYKILEKPLFE